MIRWADARRPLKGGTFAQHTESHDADEGGESMKQLMHTSIAAATHLAGVARLQPAEGLCAYPRPIAGSTRAWQFDAGINVVDTQSKHRYRWPGDRSS
jgi:hypothetical protein